MTLTLTPQSSQIYGYEYDPETFILTIQFKNKSGDPTSVWEYSRVPSVVFEDFVQAPSQGRFFSSHIKGVYQSRKVSG